MSTELGVKGYAPLPQSISNTDSEDENEECHNQRAKGSNIKDFHKSKTTVSKILNIFNYWHHF